MCKRLYYPSLALARGLTSQYAHTHGIIDGVNRSAASHQLATFPMLCI